METKAHYVFKVCLLGQGGVGKTCLARRLCFDKYDSNTKLTIGINFYMHEIPIVIDGKETHVSLTIWDFGGQEQFKTLFPYYINGANGVFLCFSMVNMQSLIRLEWWYKRIFKHLNNDIPRVIIGTKYDLIENGMEHSKIDDLFIEQFLQKYNEDEFFITSSKENLYVLDSFKRITEKMLDYSNLKYDRIL